MEKRGPFYFGCIKQPGHWLWDRDLQHVTGHQKMCWVPLLDGVLPPQVGDRVQGRAVVHVIHGWTVLAFWDSSVDTRRGSNSFFMAQGVMTFSEIDLLSREAFPSVYARFGFPVLLE